MKYDLMEGDCLQLMRELPDASVDMILCDLPYGTTQNKWDSVIPFEPLWKEYWRICTGAVVLTAQCPFDKVLGASALGELKYEWLWEKDKATGHLNCRKQPMKAHENILVFSKGRLPYNPQMGQGKPYSNKHRPGDSGNNYGAVAYSEVNNRETRFPRSVIKFGVERKPFHPTQKPVALFEYLIRTYTNENMVVLDNCMGSGTTGVACANTGRRFIGMEMDAAYFDIACDRVEKAYAHALA
jgi:site-specific DNA-methyltransferase (adenine-specific)